MGAHFQMKAAAACTPALPSRHRCRRQPTMGSVPNPLRGLLLVAALLVVLLQVEVEEEREEGDDVEQVVGCRAATRAAKAIGRDATASSTNWLVMVTSHPGNKSTGLQLSCKLEAAPRPMIRHTRYAPVTLFG